MLNKIKSENLTKEEKIKVLTNLEAVCKECRACELYKTRTNIVFSDGNPDAKILIIGEAPGKTEDETGTPFVGRSGQLLNKILESQGLTREKDVYICNTVKCRPPENRVPTREEKEKCKKFLEAQIQIINPKIILLCGSTAVASMMDTKEGITKIRGKWFEAPNGGKMMPIFHPSYLLRNPSFKEGSPKWLMNEDIKKVKEELSKI